MSSNTIDMEIEALQQEMTVALDYLIGEKNTPTTLTAIRNTVQAVVDRYVSAGILDRRPIADVNHREEIAYFETIRDGFLRKASETVLSDERIGYENDASRINMRLSALHDEVRDPERIQVWLKEPYTYEPYDWTKHEF